MNRQTPSPTGQSPLPTFPDQSWHVHSCNLPSSPVVGATMTAAGPTAEEGARRTCRLMFGRRTINFTDYRQWPAARTVRSPTSPLPSSHERNRGWGRWNRCNYPSTIGRRIDGETQTSQSKFMTSHSVFQSHMRGQACRKRCV